MNSTEKVATFSALDLLLLEKNDAETDSASAQGAGSLTGAEYTVKYYDVISIMTQVKMQKIQNTPGYLETDSKGQIKVDADHLVSGTLPTDGNGDIIFPIGTLTIRNPKPRKGTTSAILSFPFAKCVCEGTMPLRSKICQQAQDLQKM